MIVYTSFTSSFFVLPVFFYRKMSAEALSEANKRDAAALLALAWREVGLGASQPRLVALGADSIQLECVLCSGDTCEKRRLAVPLPTRSKPPTADELSAWLATRLDRPPVAAFTQPIALLAFGGILALGSLLAFPSPLTDIPLALLGGRTNGMGVFALAQLAHVIEALIALSASRQLRIRPSACAAWTGAVLLVGFPILRLLLKLQRTGKPKRE